MQAARLLFDSAVAGALPGMRGLVSEERSLLYQGETLTVDLVAFSASGGLHLVYGQVIDHRLESPVADAVVAWDDALETTRTDAFGQFSLSAVGSPAGRCVHVEAAGALLACRLPEDEGMGGGL